MTREVTEADFDALEKMIDECTLGTVLHILEQVALAKAEHLQSNWQDSEAARRWTVVQGRIAKATDYARLRSI